MHPTMDLVVELASFEKETQIKDMKACWVNGEHNHLFSRSGSNKFVESKYVLDNECKIECKDQNIFQAMKTSKIEIL